jgi:hypothetical protein
MCAGITHAPAAAAAATTAAYVVIPCWLVVWLRCLPLLAEDGAAQLTHRTRDGEDR